VDKYLSLDQQSTICQYYLLSLNPTSHRTEQTQESRARTIKTTSVFIHDYVMGKDEDFTKDAVTRTQSMPSGEGLPPPPSYEQATLSKVSASPVPNLIPGPSKVLTVFAGGTRACRFPTPSNELQIPIFDGTDTSVEPLYISTRATRRSGNAVLRHSQRGDLYGTYYKFGPFREPVIRHVSVPSDIKRSDQEDEEGPLAVSTKSHTLSYKVDFTIADTGKTFNWKYTKTQLPTGKTRVLVLETDDASSSSDKAPPKTLAVLLRTDDTRTPGSSKWDAGNGGQLVIDPNAMTFIDESLIVATCIMMLKKEIDRQRGAQAAVIGGAIGGAGG
jgi:hypothetical protein